MKKQYKNICYVSTLYSLLLYLLNCDDNEIENTFYVLDSTFPKGFENRLPHSLKVKRVCLPSRVAIWISWIYYHYLRIFKLPKVSNNTNFFIQDHKYAAKVLVGANKYTLIEDSAGVCGRYFSNFYGKQMLMQRQKWYYFLMKWMYGPLYAYHFGCGSQCTRLLLTKEDKHPWLDGKERLFIPTINEQLWNSFSAYKKRQILLIYDLKDSDIEEIANKQYLLLTDPVWPDDAPYEEHSRVFHSLIIKYPKDSIVIKTHPRDINYPYEIEFPGIPVFRKAIPMELFKLLGAKFSTIITLFSSAALQFDEATVHWYGTEVSEYCFNHYGHLPEPKKAILCNL